jgi:N6-adenosine-specific RNA methylase IME4
MADPNWRFETWSDNGRGRKSPDHHYRTDTVAEIKKWPVLSLAHRNCVLWLWGTHPMIDQQIDVCRTWGFRFVTTGVWVKRTVNKKLAFGTGYRLRSSSEPFIIGVVGFPMTTKSVRTVIEGPLREHSRKPDEAYAAAEKLLPRTMWGEARRADLFSRQTRPGWVKWGNESTKFDGLGENTAMRAPAQAELMDA